MQKIFKCDATQRLKKQCKHILKGIKCGKYGFNGAAHFNMLGFYIVYKLGKPIAVEYEGEFINGIYE